MKNDYKKYYSKYSINNFDEKTNSITKTFNRNYSHSINDSGRFNQSKDVIKINELFGATNYKLLANGFLKIKIKITIDIIEIDDGYCWIFYMTD